jgi:hypothetical protein
MIMNINNKKVVILMLVCIITSGCLEETNQVSPAPKQLYLKLGQSKQFTYRGHDIAVTYVSSSPKQTIKVVIDGVEKIFEKELDANPRGIYWKDDNLTFVLKPVVWELRDGQKVPIYEKTWNTTEFYFEVRVSEVGV